MYISQNYDNRLTFSGKKVPRYIYHLTTKANYENIQKSGFINMSKDYLSGKNAVFFIDWQNFIKRWGKLEVDDSVFLSKKTFLKYLLKGKGKRNMSLLRVPVSKLNQDDLYVRSQDILFDACTNYKAEYQTRDPILQIFFPHLFDFDFVKNVKKYTSKKHSVEYIYKNTIPKDIVEEVGTAELTLQNFKSRNNLLNFLNNLLKSTPEQKSLKIYQK